MFWKKKQIATAAVSEGPGVVTKPEVQPHSSTDKTKAEKLPGVMRLPGFVGSYLIKDYKLDPDLVNILKVVVRRKSGSEKAFDCRIFDQENADAAEIRIKDYYSLDEHPDLILYEGWYDEKTKKVQLEEKKKMTYDIPLLTQAEIQQKIEALSEPGSSVFFYQARGPSVGGPLGRGAAIIELNPNHLTKKEKKYVIYTANVVGMEPVTKRQKMSEEDKASEIAKWIKQAHHKRMY